MKNIIIGLLVFSFLLTGCVSSEVQTVDSTATATVTQSNTQTATPSVSVKTTKTAGVGESLMTQDLKITLNSAQFLDTIPNDNQFLVVNATEGKTFAVVDVTMENTGKEAAAISSIMQFKVKDPAQGYNYNMDIMSTISLKQQVDGKIQPGDKIRGKLSFEVPKDANELQLVFDFGLVDMAQAKFNIGKP